MISVLPVSQERLGSCITPHPRVFRFAREFDDISMTAPPHVHASWVHRPHCGQEEVDRMRRTDGDRQLRT